jgi:tetratricopeptide (TPR) repeat protein
MDAGLAWTIVGSVAGVAAVGTGVVFGILQLRQGREGTAVPASDAPAPPAEPAALQPAGQLSGSADSQLATVAVGEIPREPPGVQPRADLLAALDAPGGGSRVSVVYALTGMRGVGKTHLAAAYARARLAEGWRLVAWVNAEDLNGVLAGLADIAAGLDLGAGMDAQAAGRAVRHWLEVDGDRCLVVFDNVTDPQPLLPFLPVTGSAKVIITSNQLPVADLGAAVPVDVFSEDEALAFLAERTGLADAAGAQAVAGELGYLPLALAQAGAVIAGQRLDYATYLQRLRSMPVAHLLPPLAASQYPSGAAAAILLSLDSVQAGDQAGTCRSVMGLMAVLSPAGVPRTLLRAAASQGLPAENGPPVQLTQDALDRVLARLSGASLLTFSVDGTSLSAHRLVMRVIRDQLAEKGTLTTACQTAAQLLDTQTQALGRTWAEDRAAVRNLVEQITALYESMAQCPDQGELPRRMLRLRLRCTVFLNNLGDSAQQSILIGEPVLADSERILGPDHPDTLASRGNLANAYLIADRIDEAIILDEQNLADAERVLGPDHRNTLSTRDNLAAAYRLAGRIDEAIPMFERNLTDRERVLGPDHPETLRSRNNLANAYQAAGRIDEAIPMFERNLTDRERVLGPDHPETLRSRNNLANAYQAAGRIDEAIPMFERNLTDSERVLGPDHPDTLRSRNNLANAYRAAGRTDEARSLNSRPSDP